MAEALLVVTTTVGSAEDAHRLARAMVERRLAACAQLSSIESYYHWQGAVQHEPEVRIVFKSTEAAWPALRTALVELHPYELPAIHAVRPAAVHEPYARWVAEHSQGAEA